MSIYINKGFIYVKSISADIMRISDNVPYNYRIVFFIVTNV